MDTPAIEMQQVGFAYNGHPVLTSVDLEIEAGQFVALIGPNGGGKTTLIKLMLGLLQPTQGRISLLGKPPRQTVYRVGYVPQDVHINNNFPISALDVVMMGRRPPGRSGFRRHTSQDRLSALNALEKMEMAPFAQRRIGKLSGGQRQRVFIARALVTEPQVLILDEPTASIDHKGQDDFYTLLKQLNQTVTIVMVSHDILMISSYVKSVACVNRQVHYHKEAEISDQMVDMYQCPVELVAHGMPHRVLRKH